MADKNKKFPPGPPHHPCGPWPSMFPYDKDYPGEKPPRPPHPYPYPYPGQCNDTEPVIGVRPWEHCCDVDEDPCVCVTSAEVELWNETYSAVSSNSADWDKAVDDSWRDSADDWQSSYETVSANSAYWTSAYNIASSWDSGSNESIYNIISATSAFLTQYSAYPYINVNSDYFQGNGSPDEPIDLSQYFKWYWEQASEALNDLYSGGKIGDPANRRWIDTSRVDELRRWIEYMNDLFWKVTPDKEDPDGEKHEPYSNQGGVFYQLEKLWHVIRGEGEDDWIVLQENSASWNASRDAVLANSAQWDQGYSSYQYIHDYSGVYNETVERVTDLASSSGEWDSVYDTVNENSGNWESVYDDVYQSSANWDETYEKVSDSAALWNSAYEAIRDAEDITPSAKRWDAAYSAVSANSGAWNSTSATVNENSAYWSSGSHETWVYADMDYTTYSSYSELGKIYYSYYQD